MIETTCTSCGLPLPLSRYGSGWLGICCDTWHVAKPTEFRLSIHSRKTTFEELSRLLIGQKRSIPSGGDATT